MNETGPDKEADAAWTDYELPLKRGAVPRADEAPVGVAWQGDTEEMLRNQAWFCSLRWFAIAGLAVVAFFSTGVLDVAGLAARAGQAGRGFPWTNLPPAWPASAAVALLVLNLVYLALLGRVSPRPHHPAATERGLWIQILVDLGVLTTVVHFLGSVGTFAPFMYLFHIVLACIFFPYGRSLLVAAAALGMYLACLVLEHTVPGGPGPVPALGALAGQWLSVAFVSGTVWFLASRLSNALRLRDKELLAVNHRLESSLEERTAHLLRTTHQLKAPFAAIHANTQLLLDGTCGSLPGPATAVIGQIGARCEMLSRGITAMLQLANLRSTAQGAPESTDVDLQLVIRACVAAVQPSAARRAIGVDEDLRPARARVAPDHARLILENIIANAVTYSRDGQRVGVTLRPHPGVGAVVRVSDHGIGIAPAKLPRIFEDYYRTTEGARHNNASTGLGLAIVRESALASGVGVRVRSAPDRGTEFAVTFPE